MSANYKKRRTYYKGSRGRWLGIRSAAHKLEKSIKEFYLPGAEALLLTIRKHEKDYLLRHDSKYIDKNQAVIKTLADKVEQSNLQPEYKTAIKQLLDAYWQDFFQLTELNSKNMALVENLRQTVHKIEPQISTVLAETVKAANAREQNLSQTAAAAKQRAIVVASARFFSV